MLTKVTHPEKAGPPPLFHFQQRISLTKGIVPNFSAQNGFRRNLLAAGKQHDIVFGQILLKFPDEIGTAVRSGGLKQDFERHRVDHVAMVSLLFVIEIECAELLSNALVALGATVDSNKIERIILFLSGCRLKDKDAVRVRDLFVNNKAIVQKLAVSTALFGLINAILPIFTFIRLNI